MKTIRTAVRLLCAIAAAGLLACGGAWAADPVAAKAGLPTCGDLAKTCRANGACGQCRVRVCTNHTCAVGCEENVFELTRKEECSAVNRCYASIQGRNMGDGTPYWYTQIGTHRKDCTGKPATAPICINDFLDLGRKSDSINCPTLEGVRACCGTEYIAQKCAGKPALACNCYNCGQPK